MPRFDRPDFTREPAEVLLATGVVPPVVDPLPELIEPELAPVLENEAEAMVTVAHRRIRALSTYWHGDWAHAQPGCWVRAGVMERLSRVADGLPDRWGLAVFDGWRSLELQRELYETAYGDERLPPGFVSFPFEDPTTPPPHVTGGTVDLTLTLDGIALSLGGGFDDFTTRTSTAAFEAEPGPARACRRMLYWAMRSQGFVVLDCEWWHFEYGTRRWAAIVGKPARYGPTIPPG